MIRTMEPILFGDTLFIYSLESELHAIILFFDTLSRVPNNITQATAKIETALKLSLIQDRSFTKGAHW